MNSGNTRISLSCYVLISAIVMKYLNFEDEISFKGGRLEYPTCQEWEFYLSDVS